MSYCEIIANCDEIAISQTTQSNFWEECAISQTKQSVFLVGRNFENCESCEIEHFYLQRTTPTWIFSSQIGLILTYLLIQGLKRIIVQTKFWNSKKPRNYRWISNLVPKKTKKFEFGKTFMVILFEIKNNPYTPIFSQVVNFSSFWQNFFFIVFQIWLRSGCWNFRLPPWRFLELSEKFYF